MDDMTTTEHETHHTVEEHRHVLGCGHERVEHGDHFDFLHNGHRHREHAGHYDECFFAER